MVSWSSQPAGCHATRQEQSPPRTGGSSQAAATSHSQATEQVAHGETPPLEGAQPRLDRVPGRAGPAGGPLWCRAPSARGRQRVRRGGAGWARPRPGVTAGLRTDVLGALRSPPPRGSRHAAGGLLRSAPLPAPPPAHRSRRGSRGQGGCATLARRLRVLGRRAQQSFPTKNTVSAALYKIILVILTQ